MSAIAPELVPVRVEASLRDVRTDIRGAQRATRRRHWVGSLRLDTRARPQEQGAAHENPRPIVTRQHIMVKTKSAPAKTGLMQAARAPISPAKQAPSRPLPERKSSATNGLNGCPNHAAAPRTYSPPALFRSEVLSPWARHLAVFAVRPPGSRHAGRNRGRSSLP